MNSSCKVIEDLLPLYLDDLCSDQSRQLVEEHLESCDKCRKIFDGVKTLPIPHIEPEKSDSDKAVKKGFKKILFRWIASVAIITVIFISIFGVQSYYNKKGINLENIQEYNIAQEFMKQLQNGDYVKAHEYISISDLEQKFMKYYFSKDELTNIENDSLAKFCELSEEIEKLGGIESYKYVGINEISYLNDGTIIYRVYYTINFNGSEQEFTVDVSDKGIYHIGTDSSFLYDPIARFTMWAEYLWQDYKCCYFDYTTRSYIYYTKDSQSLTDYEDMNEYTIALQFMKLLQEGDYENAYEYIDIALYKKSWLNRFFNETMLMNIENDGLIKFCEYADKIEALGGIKEYEYTGMYNFTKRFDGTPLYKVSFQIDFDGSKHEFSVLVSEYGIFSMMADDQHFTEPLEQFAMWSVYLWEDYYEKYYSDSATAF